MTINIKFQLDDDSKSEVKKILSEIIQEELKLFLDSPKNIIDSRPPSEEFLTTAQTCLFLKISRPTLFKKMKLGEIPFKKLGRRLLFSRQEILSSINKGKRL